jgi:hypothetical protein
VTGKKQILIHTLIYGICGGALIVVLKLIEFRFLVIERAVEIYGALIALLFAGLGIWLGLKLTRKPELIVKASSRTGTQPICLQRRTPTSIGNHASRVRDS